MILTRFLVTHLMPAAALRTIGPADDVTPANLLAIARICVDAADDLQQGKQLEEVQMPEGAADPLGTIFPDKPL